MADVPVKQRSIQTLRELADEETFASTSFTDVEQRAMSTKCESATALETAHNRNLVLRQELKQTISTLSVVRRHADQARIYSQIKDRDATLARIFRARIRRYRHPRLARIMDVISRSGLFDTGWYALKHLGNDVLNIDPLVHYVLHGWHAGLDPAPLFSVSWYLKRNPDVLRNGSEPLSHYIQYGATEGRQPHPLFDGKWYEKKYPEVVEKGDNPLAHYLHFGLDHDPHQLFDTRWYLQKNLDVAEAGLNPLIHYLEVGTADNRDPHPLFNSAWYLEQVTKGLGGLNPLVHFVTIGSQEGRSPHPLFDGNWYLQQNPDVADAFLNPLIHYLKCGHDEGRKPHPLFDAKWYSKLNMESAPSETNALIHYVEHGFYNGAAPSSFATEEESNKIFQQLSKFSHPVSPFGDLWKFTAQLQEYLQLFYEEDTIPLVKAAYEFLGNYSKQEISVSDVPSFPEIVSLIGDLSKRSKRMLRSETPDVSIIVPVHNKIAYTLCCLRTLFATSENFNTEVIVADDCSDDATEATIKEIGGVVRLSRNPKNLGFTRNCNVAAATARGRIIVFLNNDTIILPNWLRELVATLDSDSTIGLVGSKLLSTDGTLQEAGGIVWRDGSAWNFGRGRDATSAELNYARDVDYVSGASIAVRHSIWKELGGFDEIYAPAYCEDSDLAFSIRAAGFRTVYQPFSTVIHHEGVSHGRSLSSGIKAHQVRNSGIFFRKWQKVLEARHFPNGEEVFVARDQSQGRAHILVIDHYIPQPDRDAGSRTMDYFLRLFQTSGLQTSFWPSNRYYDRCYAQPLQRLGIEVLYSLHWQNVIDEWLDENGRHLKYVLLSRADVALEYIDRIRTKTNAKILYYGHDVHFRRLEMEYAITHDPAIQVEAVASARLEREVWSKCDILYYPSEDEQKFVQAEAPSKIVRAIPPFIYDRNRLHSTRERLTSGRITSGRQVMFIGGFQHRPNVDAILWFMRDIWPNVVSKVPDARICIAGSSPPPEIQALANANVTVTGPISDSELAELYSSSRVAIIPLRFGAGIKGKVFEAMSYGTSIVTTPVGIQGMQGAENLVSVCNSPDGFCAAVVEILDDPTAYLDRALAAVSYVEQTASSEVARKVFELDIPQIGVLGPSHDLV